MDGTNSQEYFIFFFYYFITPRSSSNDSEIGEGIVPARVGVGAGGLADGELATPPIVSQARVDGSCGM